MLDATGIPYALTVSKLEEICRNGTPKQSGILECAGQIVFGVRQGYMELLVSMNEVQEFIDELHLTKISKDKLTLVFWVTGVDPTALRWHIFTEEQVQEMLDYEKERGIAPPQKH